jgi:thiol-disulfide isomerase/thioredoxin
MNATTGAPAPKISAARVIILAALAGVGLGVGGLYGMGAFERNGDPAHAACRSALPVAERLKPLAVGEVAAFIPARTPLSVADLSFTGPDGQPTTLAAWKGRTVLLNLWATWCAPCRKEMPALDRLHQAKAGPSFDVVTVNIDTRDPQKPKDFLTEINATRLVLYTDPTIGIFNSLKARGRALGMPVTVLIDANGCELGTMNGPADWDRPQALALIDEAMKP